MAPTFVLVHSPSVGPSTWRPVADALGQTGRSVIVPDLRPVADGPAPYWARVRELVGSAVSSTDDDLVLVPHSNAGLFVPLIAQMLGKRVASIVFVDAALPAHDGATAVAEPAWLEVLQPKVEADGRLPVWTHWFDESDVAPMFPDPAVRATVEAEQPRLPLDYYTATVPAPSDWQLRPCAYLWFGPPYDVLADEAGRRGWPVRRLPGLHLHTVVDPPAVAEAVVELAGRG